MSSEINASTTAEGTLSRFFKFKEHGTNLRTEILAGITTFLTMAYIVVVNPQILGTAGMPMGAVFVATCLSAALGTLIMGLLANYPIALAPGLGLNAYFTYAVVLGMGVPWQAALAAVFLSGCLFILLSFCKIREAIVNAIPMSLKFSISAGIGIFLSFIAFKNTGLIQPLLSVKDASQVHNYIPVAWDNVNSWLPVFGSIKDPHVVMTLIGVAIIAALDYLRVRGAIMIGILAVTFISIMGGYSQFYGIVGAVPSLSDTFLHLNFHALFNGTEAVGGLNINALTNGIVIVLVFLIVDLFDSTGTLVGCFHRANLMVDGKLPRLKRALFADSFAIVAGSVLGTSSTTPYIESAAGVSAGGRTGMVAVVVGVLFLLSLWFAPLAQSIPPWATAPALIYVGVLMLRSAVHIDWENITEAVPAFLTIVLIPLSYSIADGIAMGFISYSVVKLISGRAKDVPYMVWIIAILWALKFFYVGG